MFTIIPNFLRNPVEFFQSVNRGEEIGAKIRDLAISAILFLAIYGFVTGLSHSLFQALSSAVKMPVLFVATVFFSLPAYYFFSLILGAKLSLPQVTAIVLAAIGVTAFLLLGFSPITLFFVLTSNNYPFFQLLATIFVALSGLVGMLFLWQGMVAIEISQTDSSAYLRRILLAMWFFLYAFMGSQMTWRLSPFVGDVSRPFVLIQPSRDNFYVDAIRALIEVTGLQFSIVNLNAVLIGAGCLLPLLAFVFVLGMAKDVTKKNKSILQNLAAPQPNL